MDRWKILFLGDEVAIYICIERETKTETETKTERGDKRNKRCNKQKESGD